MPRNNPSPPTVKEKLPTCRGEVKVSTRRSFIASIRFRLVVKTMIHKTTATVVTNREIDRVIVVISKFSGYFFRIRLPCICNRKASMTILTKMARQAVSAKEYTAVAAKICDSVTRPNKLHHTAKKLKTKYRPSANLNSLDWPVIPRLPKK